MSGYLHEAGAASGKGGSETSVSTPASHEDQSNLSRSQWLIWTGQQLNPGAPLYNMALRFDLQGDVEVEVFQSAFQALLDRCDAMRTLFVEKSGVPQQYVQPQMHYQPEMIDLSDRADVAGAVEQWILRRSRQSFDLSVRSFDSVLLRTGPASFVWYLNQHHLTTDAWSTSVVYRKLAGLYARLRAGGLAGDETIIPAYADYLAYERGLRGTPAHTNATAYWETLAARPTQRARLYGQDPTVRENRSERLVCPLGRERSQALRELAETPGIRTLSLDMTLFNLFATVLFAYLWRVSGSTTQLIGTPAHNRSSLAFKETVGLFIELFPLRVELDEVETFRSLLVKVGSETQAYLRHALPGTSSPAGLRLFNVVLNYIHVSFEPFNGIPMQAEWVHTGSGDPEHDLRLQVHDFGDSGSLVTCFDFNCTAFSAGLRQRARHHFLQVLDACLADPDRRIGAVDLTSDAERADLVVEFNRAAERIASAETLIDLFRQQSRLTPGRTALSLGQEEVSYRQLDERSDRLARLIIERGAGAGDLVGIFIERSLEMVLGVLAVLKAGAAYVPLESRLPARRIGFILEDTGARLVLTRKGLRARLPASGPQALDLDSDWGDAGERNVPLPVPGPATAAYVIYTSGSTGMPKGVVVDHEALAAYAMWARKTFAPQEQPAFALYSSFGFDLTVTSMFVPLICGGSIAVYPEDAGTTDLAVLRVFEEGRVDTVKLTPAHLRLVADLDLRDSAIRTLILGGEDLKSMDARRVIKASGGRIAVFNEYGPTEGVVGCMVHRFDADVDRATSVPIGVPADGVRIYILDAGRNPVPEGVTGELYIGGNRLARGYFNRSELTSERFLPDPFVPGGRMYRSGDLARFNADGIIEYLGRNDGQIKVRGVRIEPAEIQRSLLEHPAIDACVLKVSRIERRDSGEEVRYCSQCGLASNNPGARIDASGVCNLCRDFETYRDRAQAYFSSMEALREIFAQAQARQTGQYDCLMLLSGGKDSTYALYQVAGIARRVLAVTLDNGFVSDGAKANIGRVVNALGIDHRYLQTPAMNAIFVDSLERHSNVCQGCFKTLYTLAVETALQEGIPLICTGLSRGQFFETRLSPVQFRENGFDVELIDRTVLEARKAYHRIDDAVSRLLNVEMFNDDKLFEQLQFVDFYRYCDVSLDEMYVFLAEHAPWIRPADTGRSTNCLINDAGIYVHRQKEGFHNYALPYSWDVRLGHKQRDAALDELNDRIDIEKVHHILQEIGYQEEGYLGESGDARLTVFFTANEKQKSAALRAFLAERLPAAMIPTSLVQLEAIPLTANGKVDYDALPDPRPGRPVVEEVYRAPNAGIEAQLAELWRAVLRVKRVGVDDNFFDLGGDSIAAIQIVAKANDAGLHLTTQELFQHQTVADLAAVVQQDTAAGTAPGSTQRAGKQTASATDLSMKGVDKKELDKLAALLKRS
ncbi:MAG: amino acid adenylation domain-containing protein [Thiogranum sp.]